jgi:hypothetical protein
MRLRRVLASPGWSVLAFYGGAVALFLVTASAWHVQRSRLWVVAAVLVAFAYDGTQGLLDERWGGATPERRTSVRSGFAALLIAVPAYVLVMLLLRWVGPVYHSAH